jgi:acyl-CoA reductase-like NAD-dependent aldehyde dehydrogenase
MAQEQKFLVGKDWRTSAEKHPKKNPYTGKVILDVCQAQKQDMEDAIVCAEEAFRQMKKLPAYKRSEILLSIAGKIQRQKKDLALLMAEEAGKPVSQSMVEVERSVFTFTLAAEEAKRIGGEVLPLDLAAHSERRWGITRRFPIGPIAGISPFNFPINLVAHKIAPAIAAGNTMVLKPPPQAPLTSLRLAQIILDAGAPPGTFNVLPCQIDIAEQLVTDDRLKMLSFTGSPQVGWSLKGKAGKKKVLLELGGNAGVIVDRTANLDFAVKRIAFGAFAYAGQICVKVQRMFIHEDIYDEYLLRFKEATKVLKIGDPLEDETVLSAVIDDAAADRIESWIAEARSAGATILVGGNRKGNIIEPTLISNTHPDMKVYHAEVFGPVVTIHRYRDIEEAIDGINDSIYGLQTGIFSNDFRNIFYAYELLDVGSVIVNDYPSYRIDHMPYGGIKDSGFGREGIRYTIDEMTELKLLAMNFI